ncbi:hypothetical protein C8J57DRAFT_1244893 [Mycena rebaudengoi]|nr:hypothetical protein C8J57DRAFT_1244893 [Mycena rebaudengoi]
MPPPKMGTLEYEVPKVAILRTHICGSMLPKSQFKRTSIGPTQSNISSSLKIPPVHLNWSAAQWRKFVVPILWRRIIALIILVIPTPDITSFGHSKPSQQVQQVKKIIPVTSRSSARIVYGSGFSATYQLYILPPTADAAPPLRPSTSRLLPNSSALTTPIRLPPRTLAGKCRTLGEACVEGITTDKFPQNSAFNRATTWRRTGYGAISVWVAISIHPSPRRVFNRASQGTLAPKINGWLPPSEE